jgi:hypothetical protein
MKNILIVLLCFILFSCSPSKVEKLISDYEQTIGNTKTDLSLKIQELKEIGKITGKDSSDFYKSKIDSFKTLMYPHSNIDTISSFKIYIDASKLANDWKRLNEEYPDYKYLKKAELWNDFKTEFKSFDLKFSEYKEKNDSVLAIKYNCTYTIKNPLLNNAKQTISKTYYVSKDLNKILKTSTK